MENSYIMAKIIGLFIIIVYGVALFSGKNYRDMLTNMMKDSNLVYVTAIFTVILGLIMVVFHNSWARDRTLIITLFGWMSLLKGVIMLISPSKPIKVGEYMLKSDMALSSLFVVMILVGIFLVSKGFMLI